MRCPHCGFEIEGEAAHCPNCGKAPGKSKRDRKYDGRPESIAAARETAEPTVTQPPKREQPKPEVQQGDTQVFTPESRPTQPPIIQPKSQRNSSYQQLQNNWQGIQPSRESQLTHIKQSRKKKRIDPVWIGIACIVVFVMIVAIIINNRKNNMLDYSAAKTETSISETSESTASPQPPLLVQNDGEESTSVQETTEDTSTEDEETNDTDGEGVPVEEVNIVNALPVGTWETYDESLRITVKPNTAVSWTQGGNTYVPDWETSYVAQWILSEEDESDHYVEFELENYPVKYYTQYDFFLYSKEGDKNIGWAIYREHDVAPEDITEIGIYNYDAEQFEVLYRVSD